MNKYILFSLQGEHWQYVTGLHQENSVNNIAVPENGKPFLGEINNNNCGDPQNQNQEIQPVSVLFIMRKKKTSKEKILL